MCQWALSVSIHIVKLFRRVAGDRVYKDSNLSCLLDWSDERMFNPVLPLFLGPDLPDPTADGKEMVDDKTDQGDTTQPTQPKKQKQGADENSLMVGFLRESDGAIVPGRRVLMNEDEANAFLAEERRSLALVLSDASKLPADGALISAPSVSLSCVLGHVYLGCYQLERGVDFIEEMLFMQLAKAIGHEVKATEFGDFMKVLNSKRQFDLLSLPP
jgi:hypothetical protein